MSNQQLGIPEEDPAEGMLAVATETLIPGARRVALIPRLGQPAHTCRAGISRLRSLMQPVTLRLEGSFTQVQRRLPNSVILRLATCPTVRWTTTIGGSAIVIIVFLRLDAIEFRPCFQGLLVAAGRTRRPDHLFGIDRQHSEPPG